MESKKCSKPVNKKKQIHRFKAQTSATSEGMEGERGSRGVGVKKGNLGII